MTGKDKLVWVSRNELDSYLKTHHVSDTPRLAVEKIAKYCFAKDVEAVIIFIDGDLGTIKPTCYMPIYVDISVYEKGGYTFEDIEGCIYLDPMFIDIRNTTDEQLLFAVKDTAVKAGYWRDDFGIVVLN